MRKLFGTDGIRGLANQEPMTPETLLRLGQAVGLYYRTAHHTPKILVGRDPRISGFMLERAFVAGVLSTGATVWEVGVIPTPGVCFLAKKLKADAGAMISASHNPVEDNGIKFFGPDGYKLPDAVEAHIEQLLENKVMPHRPVADGVGVAHDFRSHRTQYLEFLSRSIPASLSWPGWKVVVDGAHGAVSEFIRPLLTMRGVQVVAIGCQPNGVNINKGAGPLYPQALQKRVKVERADLGMCFDGDGDRALFCDEKGGLLDGDDILALVADDLLQQNGHLKTVVGTVMSNFGLEEFLTSKGVKLARAKVGDRYVLEMMRAQKAVIGGEPSGHTIFTDRHTTGDGLLTALQVLAILKRRERPVSHTARLFEHYPQFHTSVRVKEKRDIETMPGVKAAIRDAEQQLLGHGRVVVRPSGTEPIIRVMVEAKREADAKRLASTIVRALHSEVA